jgi:hypothetical protein
LQTVESHVESAWLQLPSLHCDELVSSFALNYNLRRYTKANAWCLIVQAEASFFLSSPLNPPGVAVGACAQPTGAAADAAAAETWRDVTAADITEAAAAAALSTSTAADAATIAVKTAAAGASTVGRCTLTASKPEFPNIERGRRISVLRDSCPCVVKNKPYGSPNGVICMAQGQHTGIDPPFRPIAGRFGRVKLVSTLGTGRPKLHFLRHRGLSPVV